MRFFVVVFFFIISGSVFAGEISDELRDRYLETARVWRQVDVRSMDILAGPATDISVAPRAVVSCRYVEPKEKEPGAAQKFLCELPNSKVVRVKYGKDNREIYAEVAASRLFWALGFYADEYYPVRLQCHGCPEKDPSNPAPEEKRITQMLDYAIIERKFSGEALESKPDEGWKWTELDKVSAEKGGAPLEQLDALRLLAVFVQHADSGARNQRLACYKEDLKPLGSGTVCNKPVLMIQDLGSTFGSGTDVLHVSKMSLSDWQDHDVFDRKAEAKFTLQNGTRACIGWLSPAKAAGEDGLESPVISEGGRRFLADLLNQLTVTQITNIFRVAGVDQQDQFEENDGIRKKITSEDWAAEFIKKRAEISNARCDN